MAKAYEYLGTIINVETTPQPVTRPSETAKQQVSKRCKDLATFMESLMDEKISKPELKVDLPQEEQSFSVNTNNN
jgi:hypothetical protein